MYHTPNITLVHLQAEASGIPLVVQETHGEKEKELEDLKKGLQRAQHEFGIEGVVTGALYSNYQRQRIEGICDELGLKIFSPLWHIDQTKYMYQLLRDGFVVTLSSVAAEGLDASWLMRPLDEEMIRKLISIDTKIGINVAFEGGEAESLVLDCPLFSKRIEIIDSEIKKDGSCSAQLLVHDARLVDK
jgi:asparagine synthase (glutamine-hydrolysing)